MAPERSPKRQKITTSDQQAQPTGTVLQPAPAQTDNHTPLSQRASWYNSWSRKAPAVTELARESLRSISPVSSAHTAPPESPKPRSIRSPSLAMTLGKQQSNRGLPIDAMTTKVHAEAKSPVRQSSNTEDVATEHVESEIPTTTKDPAPANPTEPEWNTPEVEVKENKPKPDEATPPQRNSWLSWIGKNEDRPVESTTITQPSTHAANQAESSQDSQSQQKPETTTENVEQKADEEQTKGKTTRRSWLPWASDESQAASETPANSVSQEVAKDSDPNPERIDKPAAKALPIEGPPKPQSNSVASSVDPAPPPSLPHDGTKPSAWAFWSRERKINSSSTSLDKPHNGELAISDTPSQDRPKRASISVPKSDKKPTDQSIDLPATPTISKGKQKKDISAIQVESANAVAIAQKVPDQKPATPAKSSRIYQNILLPELQATLKLPENPSIIQQLGRLLYITKEPELKHLSLVKDPPKIRNALAIGVHGYFPAPFIRTVIGQPTGTSIKFADMASKAIKRWTKTRGYECQVKTAALEGEGKIAERIDLLWKLLLNWIEEIRKSDFVLIACHSQGVPVAIMLVAKLVQFGCLSGARVGICAMAGVNMGPFVDYKSRFIGGSAGELFEFSDPASKVSQEYLAAMETVVKAGARITFIGSIDDQLVSLESSIFSSISHPHIYRAVSIDARLNAPNFLSHLVGFALKLRNLGIQDHGLIRELSSPLAGSLYTGDGHSRIYESDNCYDLAVDWCLLTTSMTDTPLLQRTAAAGASNPYILPFAMRGILEEDFVKTELQGEASELLQQFDDWKPTTKVLKDVKFRLEGIRSKL